MVILSKRTPSLMDLSFPSLMQNTTKVDSFLNYCQRRLSFFDTIPAYLR